MIKCKSIMKNLKIGFFYIAIVFAFLGINLNFLKVNNAVYAEDFPYQINGKNIEIKKDQVTDLGSELKKEVTKDVVKSPNSIVTKLFDLFRLSQTPYDKGEGKALLYIQRILNMLLGLVAFISLILSIFAFYLIFFSKGEDGVTKAKKILTGVAIAIFVTGISRLLVSYLFYIFGAVK
ncbi:MAG: hypothetical protein WC872_04015 [Candidatus Absconditabacterales bacterium]